MYGSHDSLTGYPVRKWWMKPFQLFSRTQSLGLVTQYRMGVDIFDIRVRIDKRGELVACHGLVEYKANVLFLIYFLEKVKKPYRVILENKIGGIKCKKGDLEYLKKEFLTPEFKYCWYVADKKNWSSTFNNYYEGPRILGEVNCIGKFIPVLTHNCNLPVSKLHVKSTEQLEVHDKAYWFDFVQKM